MSVRTLYALRHSYAMFIGLNHASHHPSKGPSFLARGQKKSPLEAGSWINNQSNVSKQAALLILF